MGRGLTYIFSYRTHCDGNIKGMGAQGDILLPAKGKIGTKLCLIMWFVGLHFLHANWGRGYRKRVSENIEKTTKGV